MLPGSPSIDLWASVEECFELEQGMTRVLAHGFELLACSLPDLAFELESSSQESEKGDEILVED